MPKLVKCCESCRQNFLIWPHREGRARFCSKKCLYNFRRGEKGPLAGGWRGGGSKHSAGYRVAYDPEHPNKQPGHGIYVYEHRKVAAEMLGRPLEKNEIVHHRNGNKQDNRPENLQVMTQSEHARLHKEIRS